MGVESALLGSIVTTIGGLAGVVLAKCRCGYIGDDDDGCNPACGSSDKPLNVHHEIEIFEHRVDDCPVLIITKNIV